MSAGRPAMMASPRSSWPLGRVMGLLAALTATIVGLFAQSEPATIALRAALAGLGVGIGVVLVRGIIQLLVEAP